MSLEAPLKIFVDESGSPVFREVDSPSECTGYVPCAVGVPTLSSERLMRILPRDKTGALIKAADQPFHADLAYDFVQRLLETDAEVAAILIDSSHPTSVAAARNNTELVNQRRQAVHHPKITEAGFSYSIFAGQLITDLLMVSLERTGSRPTFFDVVLDKAALKVVHERQWRDGLRNAGANNDTSVGDVVWTSEQAEPLLLLPDLVAGILLRDAVAGDVQRARQTLQDAARVRRISLRDGYKIPLSVQESNAGGQSAEQA